MQEQLAGVTLAMVGHARRRLQEVTGTRQLRYPDDQLGPKP